MTSESQKNKDLARELRATHFTLGNNAKNPFLSVFQKDYIQKSSNVQQSHEDKIADLRGAHFQIGNSQPVANNYTTTNTALYPQHQNYQPSQLNDEKRKDLRSHHFSLGKTDGAVISHSRNVFKEHPVTANNQDLMDARTRMRSNHHSFKETNTKYMSTLYNQEYNKEFDKKDLAQGIFSKWIIINVRLYKRIADGQSRVVEKFTYSIWKQQLAYENSITVILQPKRKQLIPKALFRLLSNQQILNIQKGNTYKFRPAKR